MGIKVARLIINQFKMPTERKTDQVVIEIDRDSRQKLKVLASMEAQTMQEWLKWVITTAYASKLRANGKNKSRSK